MRILMVHHFRRRGARPVEDRSVLEDCRNMIAQGHEVGGHFIYTNRQAATSDSQWRQVLSGAQPELLIVRGLESGSTERLLNVARSMGVETKS